MMVTNLAEHRRTEYLPGPGKPSPLMWDLVPSQLKQALLGEGCLLISHWGRKQHYSHVRFQYAPLVYIGDLYYLQRWAPVEWNVSPSQVIFPYEGWPCSEKVLRHGSFLSVLVREAIATLCPDSVTFFSGDRNL